MANDQPPDDLEWSRRREAEQLSARYRESPVEGVQLRTVGEWLTWRDSAAWQLKRFAREIAAVMPRELPQVPWAEELIRSLGEVFLTAELLVWEEPQWQAVLEAAPAFEGSRLEGLPREAQLWTWPGDRQTSPEGRAKFGLADNFDLGAMLVVPLPVIPRIALAKIPDSAGVPSGWKEALASTDLTLALYFTRSVSDPEEYGRVVTEVQRTGDLRPILPRVVVTQHRREDICRLGWETMAAGAGFLRERIFTTEKLSQSRQMRRAYERQQPGHKSEVQRVILRHVEPQHNGAAEGSGREYHSRWWVGGHWRRRAEVWNRGDGPIWVKAHVKGPEDAPLTPKSQRLTHVRR